MSAIVRARLKTQVIDGIELMEAEVGKEYIVDLESRVLLHWRNDERGPQRNLECVWDVDNGGFLPLDVLELLTS